MNTHTLPYASVSQEMDETYPHLLVESAALLTKSIDERTTWINTDRFIMHANAKPVLSAMKDIFNRPPCIRPACLAVIGDSNEGKTAVANRFFRDMGGDPANIFGNHEEMPIVLVEMPPRATEPRICLAIARALHLTSSANTKSRLVSDHVYRALVAKKVRVLILMEFQHAEPLPKFERQVVLDMVKGISNQGISVIAVGTEEARKLLGQDEQVANRMRVIHIKGFTQGQDLMDFLHSLEAFYPLPQPSGLGEKQIMTQIYRRTLGVTGEIIALCNAAAVWAVRNNKPCIDMEALVKATLLPKASVN
ncbi:MAG: TniB family NTP-binding protein [Opitutaceae bacterium]